MEHTYDSGLYEDEDFDETAEDVYAVPAEWECILIDAVRNYPHLYKKQSKDYKNQIIRDQSWLEIASMLKSSVEECQRRWTRLRERFSRERKNRDLETRSGSGSSNRKGFPLYEKMLFLAEHIQTRRTFTNLKQAKPADVKLSQHQLLQQQSSQQSPFSSKEPSPKQVFQVSQLSEQQSSQQQFSQLQHFEQPIPRIISHLQPGAYDPFPSPPLSVFFNTDSITYSCAGKENSNRFRKIISPPMTSPNDFSDDSRASSSTPLSTGIPVSTSKRSSISGDSVYTTTSNDTSVSEVDAAVASSNIFGQPIGFPTNSPSPQSSRPSFKKRRVTDPIEASFTRLTSEMSRTMSDMRNDKPKQSNGEFEAFARWMATVLERVPSTRVTKLMNKISRMVFEELDYED